MVPVVALGTIAVVYLPVSGAAQQASVCDQAIAEAGTGQGTYGRYKLIRASRGPLRVAGRRWHRRPDRLVGGSGNDVLCGSAATTSSSEEVARLPRRR